MTDIPFNIADALCPRCKVQCDYTDLKKQEGRSHIFRCPACGKPVILTDGVVKGLVG